LGRLRSNTRHGWVVEAALEGVGLAYTFEQLALPHIKAKRLMRVLIPFSPTFPGFYLYYPQQARSTHEVESIHRVRSASDALSCADRSAFQSAAIRISRPSSVAGYCNSAAVGQLPGQRRLRPDSVEKLAVALAISFHQS